MGYSCSAKASFVMSAIGKLVGAESSNALPGDAGFYEQSRKEHADGSITGSVFKTVKRYTPEERAAKAIEMSAYTPVKPEWVGDPCVRAGSFKVSGDGKIVKFPLLPKKLKAEAEVLAVAEFKRVYGSY